MQSKGMALIRPKTNVRAHQTTCEADHLLTPTKQRFTPLNLLHLLRAPTFLTMISHTTTLLLVSLVCTLLLSCATAFTISSSSTSSVSKVGSSIHNVQSPTSLSMAGFGGSGGSSSTKKKKKNVVKLPKLKAKSQWDRYNDMKQCKKITVGVRIVGEGEDEDWMEVGRVRSLNDEYTEVAVARQRALIAEHSKRLYPIKIPPNAAVEWGYIVGDTEEESQWMVVDKSKGDDAPKDIEKKIGFEGISDKATGFYCYYHEGRIVSTISSFLFVRCSYDVQFLTLLIDFSYRLRKKRREWALEEVHSRR